MTRRTDWLLNQLPMGMLDDDFFVRFVSLFQEVATTLLSGADNVPSTVDVTVAPPELVRYLGSWLGVSAIDPSLPEELQRRLVRQAGRTLAWRGTRKGLEGFLEVVTGAPAVVEDSGAILREPIDTASSNGSGPSPVGARTVTIHLASLGWMTAEDFVTLVADEIPANVSWTLFVDGEQIHPAPVLSESERRLAEVLVGLAAPTASSGGVASVVPGPPAGAPQDRPEPPRAQPPRAQPPGEGPK